MRVRRSGKTLLATQRLALREFRPGDAENLYRLNRDPRVMRYIGDGSVGTRASAAAAISRTRKHYRNYPGLGVWPAEERASGAFIGWFCLKYIPATVEVEVGYRLVPRAWGRGFATAGAAAPARYGVDVLSLYQIMCITQP